MTSSADAAQAAGRLLHWGLRPHARPAQEPEYQQLVDRYFNDHAFRTIVRQTAEGLGLLVLDASEHGLVLAPDEDSPFALRAADFRPGASRVEDRMLDGLVQLAIAAAVFPRARDLAEDSELARPPVTVDEVEDELRSICDRLAFQAKGEPDPEAGDEERGLLEAWRVYQRHVATMETKDERRSTRTTRGRIEYGLNRLREFGCFTLVQNGATPAWQSTRRYQVMVQKLAATRVYEYVQRAGEPSAPEEDES